MRSPKQFRAKSTPKAATSKSGMTFAPMASGRKTPSAKTQVKIYPQTYRTS